MALKTRAGQGAFVARLVLWLLVVFLSGCAAPQLDLSLYSPELIKTPDSLSPPAVVIGVEPFVDMRPLAHGSDNQKWKGLIPGILWLEIGTDIPEIYTAFSPFSSKPMNYTVALAVSEILNASQVSKEVFFIPHNNHSDFEYRLEGVLHRSLVTETSYFYGSFMYAWLTRVIGLPYVSYEFELDLELRLRRLATNKIIWTTRLNGQSVDKYYNVYSLSKGKDGKHLIAWNFSQIMTPEIIKSIPSLQKALQ
jgi:hypothetical protein